MKMKVLVLCGIFFAFLQVAVAESTTITLQSDLDALACIFDLGLDELKMIELLRKVPSPEDDFEYNLVKCFSERKRFFEENQKVNFKKILAYGLEVGKTKMDSKDFDSFKQLLTNAVEKCRSTLSRGLTKGQTAVKVFNCINNMLE